MSEICVETNKLKDCAETAGTIYRSVTLEKAAIIRMVFTTIKITDMINGDSCTRISQKIDEILEKMSSTVDSLGIIHATLEAIAMEYETREKDIIANRPRSTMGELYPGGTDKRSEWQKIMDRLRGEDPDAYEATTLEQEEAADEAIKKELADLMQEERFSQSRWKQASIEERKKITQEFLDEVIKIYGLQDVDPEIKWDPELPYKGKQVGWGNYKHSDHKVTLNPKALNDDNPHGSYNMLSAVCHEMRHAYQNEAVDHPDDFMVTRETIDWWNDNLDNYINYSEEYYDEYKGQPTEIDADEFRI